MLLCLWFSRMSDNAVHDDIQDLLLMMQLKNAASRAFGLVGFKVNEAMILIYVDQGVRQPRKLMKTMNIIAPTLSLFTTKLREKGLITKRSNAEDGRQVDLHLTERGHEAVAELKQAWAREMNEMRQG